MKTNQTKSEFNISQVPVEGAAGFGLLVMAAVVIYALAPLRALFAPLLLGAAIVGLVLMAWRHRETRPAAIGGLVIAGIAVAVLVAIRFWA
jgi:hypothetical protein